MTETSPNLGLPYLLPAQAQKHVTHNEALSLLDGLAQLCVENFTALTPPVAPVEGQSHALGATPTGVWGGQANRLALYLGGAWVFVAPKPGWRAWGRAESLLRIWTGSTWANATALGGLDNLPQLGVATTADSVNRLAVVADATLLSHAGGGHQVKVNKSAAAQTASLLFQTGFSGRAEIGTAGNDNLAIKVSATGSTWTDALRIPAATGRPEAPAGLTVTGTITGTAVQQSASDVTAGRLALAQHTVLRSAITGTVSQSGGVPTGAILERGANANGEFVRYADGTQICWSTVQTSTSAVVIWTFPAVFIANARCQATPYHSSACMATISGATPTISADVSAWSTAGARIQVFVPLLATGRWF